MKYIITREGDTTNTAFTLTEGSRIVTFRPDGFEIGEHIPPTSDFSLQSCLLGVFCTLLTAIALKLLLG